MSVVTSASEWSFWAEEPGVRLHLQREFPHGEIRFTVMHPDGHRSATLLNYRVADLCRFLDTNVAKQLERKESFLERIRIKAMQTGWMDHLTEALGEELNK